MDKPSANTATAQELAQMVYFMLTRDEDFVDQRQEKNERQQRQPSVAALRRRAAALGFDITPTASATRSLLRCTGFSKGRTLCNRDEAGA